MAASGDLREGLVVATFGRHGLVESPDGAHHLCHPRGKRNQSVVGDRVQWAATGDEGVIERVLPRRNLFYRQDELRTKSFAANLDQVLMLIAAEPTHSDHQLSRALITAHAQGIRPLIVLNKADLAVPFATAWKRLEPYRRMGYEVLALSLRADAADHAASLDALRQRLLRPGSGSLRELEPEPIPHSAHPNGLATLVLGPSGAGKSSLINALVPQAQTATAEISKALNSGKHTTTSTTWYWLDAARQSALIDSPGFQAFGLHHVAAADLARLMPDLAQHLGVCRFYNCTHLHEPGCAVRDQVQSHPTPSGISEVRYKIYSELFAELSNRSH